MYFRRLVEIQKCSVFLLPGQHSLGLMLLMCAVPEVAEVHCTLQNLRIHSFFKLFFQSDEAKACLPLAFNDVKYEARPNSRCCLFLIKQGVSTTV